MRKFYHWSILIIMIIALLPAGVSAQERSSNSDANEHSQIGRETHVTAAEAREVGLKFLNANSRMPLRSASELQLATTYSTSQGEAAFYVFNTQNGFVMVAADRCATPILGYSDEGAFDMNNVPIQMQSYLQGFVEQLSYGIGHPTAVDTTTALQWEQVRNTGQLTTSSANVASGNNLASTAMANNHLTKSVMMVKDSAGKMVRKEVSLSDLMNGTAENSHIVMPTLPQNNRGSRSGGNGVAPLITANWDQGCYYNAHCPADTDGVCGHVPTGCVATAMGMLMRYWGYPAQGTGTHSYTPDGYPEQTVNFGATTYDWDNMPDQLDANSTQAQIDAVSTLLWHCGVAVDMVYGAYSSSALDGSIPAAFHDYYGYCTPYYQYKEDDASWLELVKSSIDRQRPLLYFATDANGMGGHAFVCDGYNAADQLHFNWGWGGNGNGYFAVDALNVDGFQFNNDVHALFGIMPQSEFQLRYNIIEGGVEVTYEQPELGTPAYYTYPDTIVIPSQVTIDGTTYPVIAIGDKAFKLLFGLKKVVIPNSVKSIGELAFYGCGQLPSFEVVMSDSITIIKREAFNSAGIKSIDLPNTLQIIEPLTFSWCYNLHSITIPRSLTMYGDASFFGAPIDTIIWCADSCVLMRDSGSGIWGPAWAGTPIVYISDNVQVIPISCFRYMGNSSITIPKNVRYIGPYAFEYCSNLTTIYFDAKECRAAYSLCADVNTIIFGDSVRIIPSDLCVSPNFLGENTSLTTVTFGNLIDTILSGAFLRCTNITSITLPQSLKHIGAVAFSGCSKLVTVDLSSVNVPPTLGIETFEGNATGRKFLIPCESYDAYYSSFGYINDLKSVPEIDIQLTAVPNDSVMGYVDIYHNASVCDSNTVCFAMANFGYKFDHWDNGSTANPDTLHLTQDTMIVACFVKDQFNITGRAGEPIIHSDFENSQVDSIWTLRNDNYVNRWYISNLEDNDRALFVSNDSGQTNSYSNDVSYVMAYSTVHLDSAQYLCSFDYRAEGKGILYQLGLNIYGGDCLFAFLYPNSVDSIPLGIDRDYFYGYSFTSDAIFYYDLFNQQEWHRFSIDVDIQTPGTYNLVFYWRNGGSEEEPNGYPAAIDNVVLGTLDSIRGYVIGAENVDYLDTATITAVPNPGYRFVCWYDCDTNITKQVVVTGNMECVAYFEAEQYSVVVNSSDTLLGTVSGGGVFGYAEECTITATPAEGYHFFRWSDGNTDNPRIFTVTQDSVLTAIFGICTDILVNDTMIASDSYTWNESVYTQSGVYTQTFTAANGCDSTVTLHLTIIPYDTITLAVNDTLMGSVVLAGALPEGVTDLGGGSYRVPRGSVMSVKAMFDTADFGFLCWTNGNDTVSVDSVYTFTVTGSGEYTAHIEYLPTPYFYVSKTGWATWVNPHTGYGAFTRVEVKPADSDQWQTISYPSSMTSAQLPDIFTDSTLYRIRIVLYNYEPAFESREVTFDWFYVACDHFEGVNNFVGEVTDQGIALSWDAGEGPQQYLLYRDYSLIATLTTTHYLDTAGVFGNEYSLRRVFGGTAVCPYNNDSLSMSCRMGAKFYIDLTLSVDPPLSGTAAFVLPDATGHVAIGDNCTVSATANEGYSFTHWTFNGTKISVQSTYSFVVKQEGEVVAHFEYAPATDLYVSRTGWASWNNPHSRPGDNSCISTQVTMKSLDGQVLFTQAFSQPSANHCQLPTGDLADSTLYLMSVVLADTAGNSSEAAAPWYYVACDHLSGFDTVSGVFGQQGVNLSWDYPSSMTFTTATVDYDLFNGFVTDTAVMSNGGDASWAVEPQSTAGPYCNYASNVWVGDRITLNDTTHISEMEVYAFQNDFSTTSPFTGLYIQIYQGSPEDSVLVWGNADSNLMTATAFTGCYRGMANSSMIFNLRRPIMSLTASGLDIELAPGAYYLVWSMSVSNEINPIAIPHCEPIVGNTGDYGMLFTEASGWHSMHDGGSGEPFGFAFHLTGEQVLSPVVDPVAAAIYRDGELIDTTSATTYTDSEGSAENSYEVRVVYGGDRHCVYGNAAMSMACPQSVTLHCGEIFTSDTTVEAYESYEWHGHTYTVTGNYSDTLYSVQGCDSIVTLHLTITVGIDNHGGFDFKVYPNPTNGVVNVQCTMNNVQKGEVEIQVVDIYGKLVDVVGTNNHSPLRTAQIDLSRYASGVYFVKLIAEDKTIAVRKVVKQ